MKRFFFLLLVLAVTSPAYASSSSVLLVGNNLGGVVNGVQVLGATTGNTPVISSQGSDTNIGLVFTTQGSGALNLETAGAGNVILGPGSGNVVIPAFTSSGIVFNNASGVLSSGTTLPNGTTATTQSSGDNSTKVATTAYVDSAISGSSGIKSVHTQIFTSSGTYTPTTGMAYTIVEVVGGGGGGSSSAQTWIGGSGGGAGAYSKSTLTAATIGSSQTITVGSGGSGGAAGSGYSGNAGGNGGTTSFGSLVTAGGGDGASATGGFGQYAPSDPGDGGATGTGDYSVKGNPGISGFGMSGWGGGDYGPGGNGGSSILGSGGLGGSLTGAAGSNGSSGGGGGGSGPENGGYYAAGNGGGGVVIITEYCTQ